MLTYRAPANARATVITNGTRGLRSTVVTIAELAQIVRGRNPRGSPPFDRGNHLGYWIRVRIDVVLALDQQ